MRDTELPDFDGLIEAADAVSVNLWEAVDGREVPEECDDWLIKAWNHPAGVIVQFWIQSLTFWYKRKEHPSTEVERYKIRFLRVVHDGTGVGRLGRCVLARHLSMLLAIAEAWTKKNLLPLFYDYPSRASRADYAAVWDGLLSGFINTNVAEILRVPFLDAAVRMSEEPAPRRKIFIEGYTFMISFVARDPVGSWIPKLLKWANEDERIMFVRCVSDTLENMEDAQQVDMWQRWLKSYWRNRVQGIPDGLQPSEIWQMLRLLPLMERVFPESVDVAIRMSAEEMKPEVGHDMVYTLNKSSLPETYPESVAKLLIYLGRCESYSDWYEGKELIDKLFQYDLPDDLVMGLRELIAKRGLQ